MVHGHSPSLGVPSRRDGTKTQGKSPRDFRCPFYEDVDVKVFRNMCDETVRSRRNPDEVWVESSKKIIR